MTPTEIEEQIHQYHQLIDVYRQVINRLEALEPNPLRTCMIEMNRDKIKQCEERCAQLKQLNWHPIGRTNDSYHKDEHSASGRTDC